MKNVLGAALLLFAGCQTTRSIRPVGDGKVALGASLGGPMFTNLGPPIPAPLASGYGRYGISKRTDVDVGLHFPITAAAGADLGIAHLFLEQDGWAPAVMAGGRGYLFFDALALTSKKNPAGDRYNADLTFFEELSGNASWRLGARSLAWLGLSFFVQAEKAIILPTLSAGFEWRLARTFGIAIELDQMAFTSNQKFSTISWIGPSNHGALAVQVGFNFYPGAE